MCGRASIYFRGGEKQHVTLREPHHKYIYFHADGFPMHADRLSLELPILYFKMEVPDWITVSIFDSLSYEWFHSVGSSWLKKKQTTFSLSF